MIQRRLFVNGIERQLFVEAEATLASVLREQLGLTGTKLGCGEGQCGACNVILNGKLARSCVTRMKRVPDQSAVTTIEGIGQPGNLHVLQRAWIKHGAAQCGFCSPGFIRRFRAEVEQPQGHMQSGVPGVRHTGQAPVYKRFGRIAALTFLIFLRGEYHDGKKQC